MKKVMTGVLLAAMVSASVAPALAQDGGQTTVEKRESMKRSEALLKLGQIKIELDQVTKELESARSEGLVTAGANAAFRGGEAILFLIGAKDLLMNAKSKNKAEISSALNKMIAGASTFVAHYAYFNEAVERKATTTEEELKKRRDDLNAAAKSLNAIITANEAVLSN